MGLKYPYTGMRLRCHIPVRHTPLPALFPPLTDILMQEISWDKEFASQEMHLASPVSGILREEPQQASASQNPQGDADELARTAGLLLETVRDEQNPKFQNSMFMGLMKQLRDREVVVEGDQIVDNDRTSEITADAKGKQRAV